MKIIIEDGIAKIGKVKVGGYSIDGMNNRNSLDKYGCHCNLPGIKGHLGRYETDEQCKEVLQKAITIFLKNINE